MAKQWHQLEKLDHKALKKLQVEREKAQKLAQDAEEKKRRMIIGVIVMAALLVLGVFVVVMRKRAATLAFQEERNKLSGFFCFSQKKRAPPSLFQEKTKQPSLLRGTKNPRKGRAPPHRRLGSHQGKNRIRQGILF